MSRFILIPTLLASLVACESVDSSSVLTDGMYADMTATADGSGSSVVVAVLKVGGATSNTYVTIEGDDLLQAAVGETTEDMEMHTLGEYRDYSSTFAVDAEDSLFTVAFIRTVDAGAPASTMSLPAAFDLSGPASEDVIPRDQDISFSWSPSGSSDNMSYRVTGECFFDAYVQVDGDPGTAVIPAGTLEPVDEENPAACEATLTLIRARPGSLDAGFGEGGTTNGRQVRSLTFRSDP